MRVLAELEPFYMLLGQASAMGGGAGINTTSDVAYVEGMVEEPVDE